MKPWMTPKRRAVFLLAAVALAQALALPGTYLGFEHDDAIYVLAAQALANGCYRFLTMPGNPKIVLFPPGLPLTIAGIAWLFPDRPGLFTIAAWTWLVACDVLAFLWLRRRLGTRAGVPAFLIFALHPVILGRVGAVMPEVPYLAWTLLFALAAEQRWGNGWTDGAFVAWGWFFRPAAVSMLPAALADPVRRRDWKRAFETVAVLAVVMAAWRLWTHTEIQEFGELTGGRGGWARLLSAGSNVRYYAWAFGAAFAPGAPSAGLVVGSVLAALAAWGLALELRRDPSSPSAWLLLGWAGMHAFWPWQYERYLVPALPFALAFSLEGAERAWETLGGRQAAAPAAAAVLSVLLLGSEASRSWRWLASPQRPEKPDAAYDWIAAHSRPNAVYASLKWGRDTLYTARPFVPIPEAADEASLIAALKARRANRVFWSDPDDLGLSPLVHADTLDAIERVHGIVERWPAEYRGPGGSAVFRLPDAR